MHARSVLQKAGYNHDNVFLFGLIGFGNCFSGFYVNLIDNEKNSSQDKAIENFICTECPHNDPGHYLV